MQVHAWFLEPLDPELTVNSAQSLSVTLCNCVAEQAAAEISSYQNYFTLFIAWETSFIVVITAQLTLEELENVNNQSQWQLL